jgi:predicted phosphodiesterase
MDVLKIAVISDLHCKHSSGDKDSSRSTNIWTDEITITDNRHPIKALKKLIYDEGLTTDILICPGDIADKSDSQGLISGWGYLKEIKGILKAKELLATIGNHDVNSRSVGTEPPFEKLKQLDPDQFPLPKSLNGHFWTHGFAISESHDSAILIYNSCLTHTHKDNAVQSNISEITLQEMERDLKALIPKKFKFAVCHHHPVLHANMDHKDTDFIERGDHFIKLLSKYGFQLVIHGHKHDPRITPSENLSVFCAGSFSSRENLMDTGADNTFHIIELNANNSNGIIKTWIFLPSGGWQAKTKYFPVLTGFGFNGNLDTLAKDCADWFKTKGRKIVEFKELIDAFVDFRYLKPDDQEYLHQKMLLTYNIEFVPELRNSPKHICLQEQ